MTARLRKLALTVHVTLAVGWVGALLGYLVLVVAAMRSEDSQVLRASWLAMELIGRQLIVPLAFGALVTGIVMALGTPWGLFRHYWVVLSLALTSLATLILVQHMETVGALTRMAAEGNPSDLGRLVAGLRGELLHAGVGLLVLLVIEALNIFKPRGMTVYGRRRAPRTAARSDLRLASGAESVGEAISATPVWVRVLAFHAVALAVLLVIVLHLTGRGMGHP